MEGGASSLISSQHLCLLQLVNISTSCASLSFCLLSCLLKQRAARTRDICLSICCLLLHSARWIDWAVAFDNRSRPPDCCWSLSHFFPSKKWRRISLFKTHYVYLTVIWKNRQWLLNAEGKQFQFKNVGFVKCLVNWLQHSYCFEF